MKNLKLIKQHDEKDCGVVCLAMILKTYDTTLPISKLRIMSGTNTQGTSAYGLVMALESLGFKSEVFQTDCLIWNVVVYGRKRGKLLIADPARGKLKKTPEAFNQEWTGIVLTAVPDDDYEPIHDTSNGLFSFIPLLKSHKRSIIGIVFLSFILTGFGIIGSYYFQIIIDQIVPTKSIHLLTILSVGLLSMYMLQGYFKQYLLIKLGQRLSS